ncbi:MAG: hypothetical protein K2V38_24650 [Gemmataceae bacterium]|nr:hypothetical protein [Gemmataceae bacterium]
MRAIRCVLAAVLAAGIVTVVAAQPGGFGGFRAPGDVTSLVTTNTALQDELKLTADQKTKLKALAAKQDEITKARQEMFKGGFDKDKFTELNEKSTKVTEEITAVLTADQKKRLKQIAIQDMGLAVFNDPEAKGGKGKGFVFVGEAQKALMKEVAEALKLNDKQKEAVKGVSDEFSKESTSIFKDSGAFSKETGFDQEKWNAAQKKVDKISREYWDKVTDGMTADQKAAWKTLVGEPFDVAKLRAPIVVPKKKD